MGSGEMKEIIIIIQTLAHTHTSSDQQLSLETRILFIVVYLHGVCALVDKNRNNFSFFFFQNISEVVSIGRAHTGADMRIRSQNREREKYDNDFEQCNVV